MISWLELAAVAYALLNIAAFAAFWVDKRNAVRHRGRLSERSLLVLSFLGPFGAFAGMRAFHHKTRKRRFLLVPFFLMVHVAIVLYILYGLIKYISFG